MQMFNNREQAFYSKWRETQKSNLSFTEVAILHGPAGFWRILDEMAAKGKLSLAVVYQPNDRLKLKAEKNDVWFSTGWWILSMKMKTSPLRQSVWKQGHTICIPT